MGAGGGPGPSFPSLCNRKVPLACLVTCHGSPQCQAVIWASGMASSSPSPISPSLTHWVLSLFLLFSFYMIHLSLFSLLPVPELEKVLGEGWGQRHEG